MGQSSHQGTYFCLICGTWKNGWNGMMKGQEHCFPIDPHLVDILADMDSGWETCFTIFEFQVSEFLRTYQILDFPIHTIQTFCVFVNIGYHTILLQASACNHSHILGSLDFQSSGQPDSEQNGRMIGCCWVVEHQKAWIMGQPESQTFVNGERVKQKY